MIFPVPIDIINSFMQMNNNSLQNMNMQQLIAQNFQNIPQNVSSGGGGDYQYTRSKVEKCIKITNWK